MKANLSEVLKLTSIRLRFSIIAIAIIFFSIAILASQSSFLMRTNQKVAFGVYDPAGDFTGQPVLIEHHFVTWRLDNARELTNSLSQIRQAHRFPLITLESWPWEWQGMVQDTLLQDIVQGKYDHTLELIFQVIQQQAPQKILLRWGHEMEIVGQYPWSSEDSNAYIKAYRYIVDFSRERSLDNIIWVWSPAGNKNALKYWPGEDYVDYIGISIYGAKEFNSDRQKSTLFSFKYLMTEKYWLTKKYHKPMIVAEFGVSGNYKEKSKWLIDAVKTVSLFPQVKALIYFNQIQPDIVPLKNIGQLHWELNSAQVSLLSQTWAKLNNDNLSTNNITDFLESYL